MNSRHVTFPGGHGDELAGILDLPDSGEPGCYALFAHCFTCGKELKSMVRVNRVLTGEGIGVLRFDFTGFGGSGGDFATAGYSSNVADMVAAARFLKENYAPPKLLIGHSLGGTAAFRAVPLIPSCRGLVTIGAPVTPAVLCPLFAGKEQELFDSGSAEVIVGGRPFRFNREFVDDISAQGIDEALAALPCPLLILHAPGDATVGFDHASRIFATAPHPKSIISLDTAGHLLLDDADARWVGEMIVAWGRRYLEFPDGH
jgi:uncharacterized protein